MTSKKNGYEGKTIIKIRCDQNFRCSVLDEDKLSFSYQLLTSLSLF